MEIARRSFEYFGLLCLAGCLAALLHHYGTLNFQASILLGFAFAIIAIWLYLLKQVASFKPYRLTIGISYDVLWEDLKLTPIDGPKFQNFTFVAISPSIFKRSDHREYSTTVYLYEQIPTGTGTWTPGVGEIRNGPTFYLRPVRSGYEFGVQVRADWWKLHKEQLAPTMRDLPLTYNDKVVLGILPYGYIPNHVRRWDEPVSLWYRFDSKQQRWKKRLERQGWTFSENYPGDIEHRYISVGYSDL